MFRRQHAYPRCTSLAEKTQDSDNFQEQESNHKSKVIRSSRLVYVQILFRFLWNAFWTISHFPILPVQFSKPSIFFPPAIMLLFYQCLSPGQSQSPQTHTGMDYSFLYPVISAHLSIWLSIKAHLKLIKTIETFLACKALLILVSGILITSMLPNCMIFLLISAYILR